ncbi:uncharacterized protein [Euphorbia lathyris]|uniref:uncharacterized protein n=1 Tax=Euphorbia lathyris TaxID=212925 RepID=UPI003313CAC6
MDPLPNINKSYSMLLKVEKNNEISIDQVPEIANFAQNDKRGFNFRGKHVNDSKTDKHCDNCDMPGHVRSTCFKIIGYPEWHPKYKQQNQQRHPKGRSDDRNGFQTNKANAVQIGTSKDSDYNNSDEEESNSEDMKFMIQEVYKMLKGKGHSDTPIQNSDFTAFVGFSG